MDNMRSTTWSTAWKFLFGDQSDFSSRVNHETQPVISIIDEYEVATNVENHTQ